MTTTEYNAWKKATEASRYHWTVDQCQLANSGRYLIFKGGTAGQFVTVEQDGTASIGTYEGAIPCITDACFQVKHTRKFANQNDAMKALIERAGLKFLLDLTGIQAYR
jgi:hypothetical protein